MLREPLRGEVNQVSMGCKIPHPVEVIDPKPIMLGCPRCTRGYIRCEDPECAICASDNDPRCPNSTPCPLCNREVHPQVKVKYLSDSAQVYVTIDCGEVLGEDHIAGSMVFSGPTSQAEAIRDKLILFWRG